MDSQPFDGAIPASIVIPCHNDGRFLLEAVGSAEQSGVDAPEIIVVNDGSSDPLTLEILEEISRRGHQVIHQANRGLGAARNRGIAAARGRYILPLDSDNKVRPEYLRRAIPILEQDSGIAAVYGDRAFFGDVEAIDRVPDFELGSLLLWNYIDACAVFRKSAWEKCGGYDEQMPFSGFEDWDFWCRVACQGGGFRHVPEVLYDYRRRGDSMSSGMATSEKMSAILAHMQAKKVELTMGQLRAAYLSQELLQQEFRRRPLRTLLRLLADTCYPSWMNRRHARFACPS